MQKESHMPVSQSSRDAVRRDAPYSLGLFFWGLLSVSAFAQAPEITYLYPAGGERGTEVTVTLGGKPGSLPLSVHADRGDVRVEVDEEGKQVTVTAEEQAVPGLCWLRFYNEQGAGEPVPFLIGSLPEINESEPNNLPEQANPVSLPAVVNGTLHRANEVDLFAVDLEAGQTLIASVVARELLGSPMDPVLQVLAPAGHVMEQNDDDHGIDPLIEYRAVESGRHYVRIFAFPADPNSTVRFAGADNYVYRLTLTTGPFLDHLLPGDEGQVIARGWNLETLGSDSAEHSDAPSDRFSAVRMPLEAALQVPTFQSDDALRRLAAADFRSESVPDGPLPVPVTVVGAVGEPGGVETFSLAVTKDQGLRLETKAVPFQSQLDPVLKVLDESGKVLQENDDESRNAIDAALSWKGPADGNYEVQVTDRFSHGGWRHLYELSIREPEPEYELTVSPSRFSIKGGASVEITVTVARSNGFQEELTITAIDLPEGVSSEPVVSEAKGDSSKSVTLKLTAADEITVNAPFRIVGQSESSGAERNSATAALKSARARTETLWLTVTGE